MSPFPWLFAITILVSPAFGQTANVDAKADFSWVLPTTCNIPAGQPISACPITKVQAFVGTSPIADTATTATAELPATATTFSYTAVVANGSILYGRFKACGAQACSAFSSQTSKSILISIPGVPTGVAVTVTVTVSTGP